MNTLSPLARIVFGALLSISSSLWAASIPAGTEILVRTSEVIRGSSAISNRAYVASIEQDIQDEGGAVVIPKGSPAALTVNKISKSNLSLVLASVTVDGIKYAVDSADVNQSSHRKGIGKNRRTGEMVGGGAATGALIGGIAGGGVGALIGAAAGASAGGAAQTLTRGKEVMLPTESVLRFHLSQPLALAEKK